MRLNLTGLLRGTVAAAALTALALAPHAARAQAAPGATFNMMRTLGNDATDGSRALGGLTADSSGDLIGTTSYRGPDNDGTLYEITPSGKESTIDAFTDYGIGVTSSLVLGPNGNF